MAHWVNHDKKAVPLKGFVNRTEPMVDDRKVSQSGTVAGAAPPVAGRSSPTAAQRGYLARGLTEPGGKLPLFDRKGREIARKTVESCLARGWAEPWFDNPLKPDWIVCRLTDAGYRILGAKPPVRRS
jgi:hypothetical protein